MSNEVPVTLYSLAGGRVAEVFDAELHQVVENMMDPNTELDKIREINLKVRIRPDGKRTSAAIDVRVTSKTAPIHSVATQIFFGRHKGELLIQEADIQQLTFDQAGKAQLVDMKTGEVKK